MSWNELQLPGFEIKSFVRPAELTVAACEEYRNAAWDCLQMAEATHDPKSRVVLLQIAQTWAGLAQQAEKNGRLDPVYETPPLISPSLHVNQ